VDHRHRKLEDAVFALAEREDRPVEPGTVVSIVAQAKVCVELAKSPDDKLQAIAALLSLRNELTIRKDSDNQKVLRKLVEHWIGDENDKRVKRWLDQSINMPTDPVRDRARAEQFFQKARKIEK
jgi:hypothetical protein